MSRFVQVIDDIDGYRCIFIDWSKHPAWYHDYSKRMHIILNVLGRNRFNMNSMEEHVTDYGWKMMFRDKLKRNEESLVYMP